MARPGKEQIFFLASLALTGLLGALLFTGEWKAPAAPRGKKPPPVERKDVGKAPRGARADSSFARAARESFREPRDWLPLPAAALERPPLREPAYVPPPPRPAAGLDHLGLYRMASEVTKHAFPEELPPSEAPVEDEPVNAATAASATGTNGAPPRNAAREGNQASRPAASAPALDDAQLKKRFDWLEVVADPRPWYGVILNPNKFDLDRRPAEEVQFQRLDPKTGRVMVGGNLSRDRIKPNGIHFAETAANRTELLLRKNPESQWSATRLPALLDVIREVMPLGAEDPVAWRRAAEHLAKYVTLDPRHARTWELLADARAALLDYEGELAALKEAQAAGAESAGLIARQARWLARIGAKGGALARLAEGVSRFPNERELRLAYGRALLDRGAPADVELALTQFQAAEQGSGTAEERMEVIAEVGAALLERGDAERALQEAKRILNVDRNALSGLRLEGAAQFALGRFTDAQAQWSRLRAAAGSPALEAETSLNLGLVRTRLGEFDPARDELRRVPQLDPRLGAAAAAAEGDLMAVTDHLEAAVARCRDAVARAPDDPYLRYFLGRMLRRTGDHEGARAELRRALDLGASFPDLFTELGFLALLEGDADAARRYFEESLAREERDETRLLLAHAHLLAGDLAPARTLLEGQNAKKPSSEAMLGLAYYHYKRNESPAAQQLWQQVKDDLPDAHPDDKAYAAKWLATVLDLESKQVWEDSIAWHEVGNGWELEARYGIDQKVVPGAFKLVGTQKPGSSIEQWTYLKRDVELVQFFEYEVEVAATAENQGRVGFGLAHFMGSAAQQAPQVRAALLLAVEPDGTVVVQHREQLADTEWKKLDDVKVDWKSGEPVRLGLRRKERGSAQFQFFVNGAPAGDWIEMNPWRGKSKQQISALFFAAAAPGRKVDAELQHARRVEFLPQ